MPSAFQDSRKPASPLVTRELMERATSGDRAALGRLISLIENDSADLDVLLRAIFAMPPRAQVIGVTGPPGAGKSTFVGALLRHYRNDGCKVAVIAVDPSSPVTRGAVLGDRIRMAGTAPQEGVFIRSIAARGQLGGLSGRTGLIVDLMDAVGYDTVIVETVGVGQSEVAIAALAQTTVVLLAPGLGDDIQSLKAGILEVADLFVVNKSDLPGAEILANHLDKMPPVPGRTVSVEVLMCSAVHGEGIADVVAALDVMRQLNRARHDTRADRLATLLREAALQRFAERLNAASEVRRYSATVAAGTQRLDCAVDMLIKDLALPAG